MQEVPYKDVKAIDSKGIATAEIYIDFAECSQNYAAENDLPDSRCVAARDVTKKEFVFYTIPKTKLIFDRVSWKDALRGKTAIRQFHDLQKMIVQQGYSSYDNS